MLISVGAAGGRGWRRLLVVVLATVLVSGLGGVGFPSAAMAESGEVYCDDGASIPDYTDDSQCAAFIAFYVAEGCDPGHSDVDSGGVADDRQDTLFVDCPGPVPPPGGPGTDPPDPAEGPFTCNRAPLDPAWVYAGDGLEQDWQFLVGNGEDAGLITFSISGGSFTTDTGYSGFREVNAATGAERLVMTGGVGIAASTGNCLHLDYAPGLAAADAVAGTQTRYGNYYANSSVPLTAEAVIAVCDDDTVYPASLRDELVGFLSTTGAYTQTQLDAIGLDPCTARTVQPSPPADVIAGLNPISDDNAFVTGDCGTAELLVTEGSQPGLANVLLFVGNTLGAVNDATAAGYWWNRNTQTPGALANFNADEVDIVGSSVSFQWSDVQVGTGIVEFGFPFVETTYPGGTCFGVFPRTTVEVTVP